MLTDAPADSVYAALVHSEIMLREELDAAGMPVLLPERWWLRLDISKCPQGPVDNEAVFSSTANPDDELAKGLRRLRQWQRIDDLRFIIPGFLIEASPSQPGSVGAWCRQGFSLPDKFPKDELAIVVCLKNNENDDLNTYEALRALREGLATPEHIPVFIARWTGQRDQDKNPKPVPKQDNYSIIDDVGITSSPGSALRGLVEALGRANPAAFKEQVRTRKAMYEIVQVLRSITSGEIDEADAVRDLESICDWAAPFKADARLRRQLHTDILEIAELAGTLGIKRRLISRCAASDDEELRFAALEFSMKKDIYLDWWVEGAWTEERRYPPIERLIELNAMCDKPRPPLQLLVLAVLRAERLTSGFIRIAKNRYEKFLLSDFRQLLDIPARGFKFSECSDPIIPLVLMACKFPDPSNFDHLPEVTFSSLYLWWTLQSIQVKREWLRKVIRRSAEERRILGLIDSKEAVRWETDQVEYVREFRRGLPLSYYYSATLK